MAAQTSTAQITLRGRVTDLAGAPVQRAEVGLLTDTTRGGAVLAAAVSDSEGSFLLSVPSAGRYSLLVRRIDYVEASRLIELHGQGADTVVVRLQDYYQTLRVRDSILSAKHRERVAAARARGRHWVCGAPPEAARAQADSAYDLVLDAFSSLDPGRLADLAVPLDHLLFIRHFVRPLTSEECRRFAEGLDRGSGLESDTVRVFRFGKVLFIPDWLEAGGAFYDFSGNALARFGGLWER